jgi:hypothetical protein
LVGLKSSSGKEPLNVFLPKVSQANISIYKMYRCSRATNETRMVVKGLHSFLILI